MIRTIVLAGLLCTGCLQAQSQATEAIVEDIFETYGGMEEMNTINLSGSFFGAFQKKEKADGSDNKLTDKVKSFRMISSKEGLPNPVDKKVYNSLLASLKSNKWETLVETKDKDGQLRVFIREEPGKPTEAIVLTWGAEKFSLFELTGLFQRGDLDNLDLDMN